MAAVFNHLMIAFNSPSVPLHRKKNRVSKFIHRTCVPNFIKIGQYLDEKKIRGKKGREKSSIIIIHHPSSSYIIIIADFRRRFCQFWTVIKKVLFRISRRGFFLRWRGTLGLLKAINRWSKTPTMAEWQSSQNRQLCRWVY